MNATAKLGIAGGAAAALALGGGLFLWQKQPKPKSVPAAIQTESRKEHIGDFPIWEVRYLDKGLGEVRGRAFVDWDRRQARVELIDPVTGKLERLYANPFETNGDSTSRTQLTFNFQGKSPAAPPTKPPSTAGLKQIAVNISDKANVTPATQEFEVEVKEKVRADLDQVKVSLSVGPSGMLRGSWSYKADPLTERDRKGGGRQGYYRLLNKDEVKGRYEGFLGEQSGTEEWTPILPSIAVVKVIEDQLAFENNNALYMYPDNSVPSFAASRSKQRTLFVVGRNFPVDGSKQLCQVYRDRLPSGELEEVELTYSIEALSSDPNLDAKAKEVMEKAWTKVLDGLSNEEKSLARAQLQAALVRVHLPRGVKAGPKVFSWCGEQGSWFLQFGDNTAEARFIRSIAHKTNEPGSEEKWEYTDSVFLPEQVQIEVISRGDTSYPEFPVHVGRKGTEPASWTVLTARKVGGSRYRTDPFTVVDSGRASPNKGVTISASPKDKLQATVQLDDVQFIAPPIAEADVYLTPERAPGSPLWKEVVDEVEKARASLANYHGVPGGLGDHPPEEPLKSYHGISVSVADHAAMLLLQKTFVAMLEEEQGRVTAIQSPSELLGFREWLRPFLAANEHRFIDPPKAPVGWEKYPDSLRTLDAVNDLLAQTCAAFSKAGEMVFECFWNGRKPSDTPAFGQGTYWGDLDVSGPSGGSWKFWETYLDDGALEHPSGGGQRTHAELAEWRSRATKEVLEDYKEKLKDAIEYAKGIKPYELQKLIHLTGIDFSAAVIRVMPRLVRLDESGGTLHWVPDPVARPAVAHVNELYEAALANEKYTDTRDKMVMTVVVGILSAPAAIWDSASVAAYSWAANAGLTALQSGETIAEQFTVRKELDRLFGASGVIGTAQLDDTMLRKSKWSSVVLSLIPDLLQNAPGAFEHLPFLSDRVDSKVQSMAQALRRELAVSAAADAVNRLKQAPLKIVAKLPKPNLEALIDLFSRSGTRLERVGVTSAEEAEAVYQAGRIADEVGEAKTGAVLHEQVGSEKTGALENQDSAPALEHESEDPIAPWKQYGAKTEPWAPPEPPPSPASQGTPGTVLPKTEPWSPPKAEPVLPVSEPPAAVAQPRDVPLPNNPPKETSWKKVTHADGKEIEYKVERITSGSSSDVYKVVDIRGGGLSGEEAAALKEKLLGGDGSVIKLLLDDTREPSAKLYPPHFGNARQQIERMMESYKTVEAAHAADPAIEFQKVLEWHPEANPPYFIQQKLRSNQKTFKMKDFRNPNGTLMSYETISGTFTRDMQEGVVRLYRDLAKQNLVGLDLSLPNLYFEVDATTGKCKVGILDIDFIVKAGEVRPPGHAAWDWIRKINEDPTRRFSSVVHDSRAVGKAPVFMEKMLEYKYGGQGLNGWVEYSILSKRFKAVLIDPDIIKKYFPAFRSDLTKSSWLTPVLPWLRHLEAQAKRVWAAAMPQPVPLAAY